MGDWKLGYSVMTSNGIARTPLARYSPAGGYPPFVPMQARTALFISRSSQDDGFVRELQQALQPHGVDAWIDSRQLRPGGLLESEIMTAIENAAGFTFLVTSEAHKSPWVFKELKHALKVQTQRDQKDFPVFALLLDNAKLGAFEGYFDAEPLNAHVTSDAGGVETAVNEVLIALGKRNRADVPPAPQPKAEPLEELVLELTDLKFHEQDGIRRASASARLVYQPATPGQCEVASAESRSLDIGGFFIS